MENKIENIHDHLLRNSFEYLKNMKYRYIPNVQNKYDKLITMQKDYKEDNIYIIIDEMVNDLKNTILNPTIKQEKIDNNYKLLQTIEQNLKSKTLHPEKININKIIENNHPVLYSYLRKNIFTNIGDRNVLEISLNKKEELSKELLLRIATKIGQYYKKFVERFPSDRNEDFEDEFMTIHTRIDNLPDENPSKDKMRDIYGELKQLLAFVNKIDVPDTTSRANSRQNAIPELQSHTQQTHATNNTTQQLATLGQLVEYVKELYKEAFGERNYTLPSYNSTVEKPLLQFTNHIDHINSNIYNDSAKQYLEHIKSYLTSKSRYPTALELRNQWKKLTDFIYPEGAQASASPDPRPPLASASKGKSVSPPASASKGKSTSTPSSQSKGKSISPLYQSDPAFLKNKPPPQPQAKSSSQAHTVSPVQIPNVSSVPKSQTDNLPFYDSDISPQRPGSTERALKNQMNLEGSVSEHEESDDEEQSPSPIPPKGSGKRLKLRGGSIKRNFSVIRF